MQELGQVHNELFERGNYAEAASQFEKLINDNPNCAQNPLVHFNLAQCYIELKQWSKANKQLEIAQKGFENSENF